MKFTDKMRIDYIQRHRKRSLHYSYNRNPETMEQTFWTLRNLDPRNYNEISFYGRTVRDTIDDALGYEAAFKRVEELRKKREVSISEEIHIFSNRKSARKRIALRKAICQRCCARIGKIKNLKHCPECGHPI